MKKILYILFFQLACLNLLPAQEKPSDDPDMPLKQELYAKYKNEVRSYSHKDFDAYFMEYFSKLNQAVPLTKEEYYTYTIKIAIYSEKLGLLYKDKKDEAQKSKQEWFSKKYSDYLSNRQQKTD